jgi:predicted HTH transcriptional regulator
MIVQLLCNYAGRDSKLHNAKIVGKERIETWEFPIDAIREGITNKMNILMQK